MLAQEVIRKKRSGEALQEPEIRILIEGMLSGQVTESHMSDFAKAVFFQGMTPEECQFLTACLQHSGTTLDWSTMGLPGPVVDKHSTGGVGDKVSLMLAPMLAACGVFVPMISGRGLGHSGGTLDKMESIPGYDCQPNVTQLQKVVAEVGCAIVGQTADLAPADKQLYGIRDVTATVESLPLITASILSKKLAAGLDALVMDVKVGSGAFNNTMAIAETLAQNLVKVAYGNDLPTTAIITDMNQNLGHSTGNAVEVLEAVAYLTGDYREPRLHEVTMQLCIEILVLCGRYPDADSAQAALQNALDSDLARDKFDAMVVALGGPDNFSALAPELLPKANLVVPYHLPIDDLPIDDLPIEDAQLEQPAYIKSIDGRALGNAVIALGGGRVRPQDAIDHAVGFSQVAAIGAQVSAEQPLLFIHAQSEEDVTEAKLRLQSVFEYTTESVAKTPTVLTAIKLHEQELVIEHKHG
ncbi:MAG: thymidine phosphorylase [Gammaproteobacteria bacterium]|nr:thymidine phosphorylase [Gammaproteobacteria bacterium]